jgi:hypothetical protein
MGSSRPTASLVAQHQPMCARSVIDPLPTLVMAGDVFFQRYLAWSLAIAYSAFGEHRSETRSLSTKTFSAQLGARVEQFAARA